MKKLIASFGSLESLTNHLKFEEERPIYKRTPGMIIEVETNENGGNRYHIYSTTAERV